MLEFKSIHHSKRGPQVIDLDENDVCTGHFTRSSLVVIKYVWSGELYDVAGTRFIYGARIGFVSGRISSTDQSLIDMQEPDFIVCFTETHMCARVFSQLPGDKGLQWIGLTPQLPNVKNNICWKYCWKFCFQNIKRNILLFSRIWVS